MSWPGGGEPPALLVEVLTDARSRGFLGPGDVVEHIAHAHGFAAAAGTPPTSFADLGSGGGVPALVLALLWPASTGVLIESQLRRVRFLLEAVRTLDLAGRLDVVEARAEDVGRDPHFRGAFPVVTARSFGPPAVVAECGASLLELGGVLIVSEPPADEPARWPAEGLEKLGLQDEGVVSPGPRFRRLVAAAPCPASYPRRAGIPSKRPLF